MLNCYFLHLHEKLFPHKISLLNVKHFTELIISNFHQGLYSNSKGIIHLFIVSFRRKRLISLANQLIHLNPHFSRIFPKNFWFSVVEYVIICTNLVGSLISPWVLLKVLWRLWSNHPKYGVSVAYKVY